MMDLNLFLEEGDDEEVRLAPLEVSSDIEASSSFSSCIWDKRRRSSDEEVGDEAEGEYAHKFPLIYVHEGNEYALKLVCSCSFSTKLNVI